MSRRVVGFTAAGFGAAAAAAAALAVAGRPRCRARAAEVADEPRGEAHMWGIVAGLEPAEQLLDD